MTWSPHTRSVGGKIPKRIVLQYDIADAPGLGQILIRDDHFVHLFYPKVPVKPQRFVFVLDTSSLMSGTKLRQLKDVMTSILKGLHANRNKMNQFSIITFNREVKVSSLLQNDRVSSWLEYSEAITCRFGTDFWHNEPTRLRRLSP